MDTDPGEPRDRPWSVLSTYSTPPIQMHVHSHMSTYVHTHTDFPCPHVNDHVCTHHVLNTYAHTLIRIHAPHVPESGVPCPDFAAQLLLVQWGSWGRQCKDLSQALDSGC